MTDRSEYKKQWRLNNAEHIKEQSKEYYETHKDKILQYKHEYRKLHKEEIQEKRKILCECDVCGVTIRRCGLAKHQRTNKCKKASNSDK